MTESFPTRLNYTISNPLHQLNTNNSKLKTPPRPLHTGSAHKTEKMYRVPLVLFLVLRQSRASVHSPVAGI